MARLEPTAVQINNGPSVEAELTIEVEQIDATPSRVTKPDMGWEHVDSAGHYHAWTDDGTLPTLTPRTEHVDCAGAHLDADYSFDEDEDEDEECEGYDITVYDCAACGERIEPKTISYTPRGREVVPSRKHWTVTASGVALTAADMVSVKVTTPGAVLFGVGMAETAVQDTPFGPQATTTITGVGELGRRQRGQEILLG